MVKEAETPILWPPDAKSWLIWKDPDAGKDWGQEEKGTKEDEMVGWYHQHNGHGFGWTSGVGDGQWGLACCGSWGHKESDTTEWLNWTELKAYIQNLEKKWYWRIYLQGSNGETSLVAQMAKCPSTMWDTRVWSLGWEHPLEKEMATHSSVLAWRIPGTGEPGAVWHDWSDLAVAATLRFLMPAQ